MRSLFSKLSIFVLLVFCLTSCDPDDTLVLVDDPKEIIVPDCYGEHIQVSSDLFICSLSSCDLDDTLVSKDGSKEVDTLDCCAEQGELPSEPGEEEEEEEN